MLPLLILLREMLLLVAEYVLKHAILEFLIHSRAFQLRVTLLLVWVSHLGILLLNDIDKSVLILIW